MGHRVIPDASSEMRVLAARLAEIGRGEEITYDELTDLAGVDVRAGHPGYNALRSARRWVESNHQKVFAPFGGERAGEGLWCCTDEGVVRVLEDQRKRAAKAARRVGRLASCITDIDALNPDLRTRVDTEVSIGGFMATFTRANAVKKVEAAVRERSSELPLGKLAQLFTAKGE